MTSLNTPAPRDPRESGSSHNPTTEHAGNVNGGHSATGRRFSQQRRGGDRWRSDSDGCGSEGARDSDDGRVVAGGRWEEPIRSSSGRSPSHPPRRGNRPYQHPHHHHAAASHRQRFHSHSSSEDSPAAVGVRTSVSGGGLLRLAPATLNEPSLHQGHVMGGDSGQGGDEGAYVRRSNAQDYQGRGGARSMLRGSSGSRGRGSHRTLYDPNNPHKPHEGSEHCDATSTSATPDRQLHFHDPHDNTDFRHDGDVSNGGSGRVRERGMASNDRYISRDGDRASYGGRAPASRPHHDTYYDQRESQYCQFVYELLVTDYWQGVLFHVYIFFP